MMTSKHQTPMLVALPNLKAYCCTQARPSTIVGWSPEKGSQQTLGQNTTSQWDLEWVHAKWSSGNFIMSERLKAASLAYSIEELALSKGGGSIGVCQRICTMGPIIDLEEVLDLSQPPNVEYSRCNCGLRNPISTYFGPSKGASG